jgi:predicted PurR-regulated permease PerM
MNGRLPFEADRSRIAWWLIVAVLGTVAVGFVVSFVGTFVLGLFFYYAVRPLHERVDARVGHRSVAAVVTLALILLPVLGLVGYTVLLALGEVFVAADPATIDQLLRRVPGDPASVRRVVQSPGTVVAAIDNQSRLVRYALRGVGLFGTMANGVLHVTLALSVAFFLLRDAPRLETWFRTQIADDDGIAETYVSAVDADLQTVYFGNVLSVVAVAMLSLVVYHGFNLVAPSTVSIPFPTLLALLTGLATFVPLVVGKLVYLPLVVYLAYATTQADAAIGLAWVLAFGVVAFLLLDLIPQTFIRPYISGRSLHSGLVLFAYVLGAALFGWYGLFLGPLAVVLIVQAANVVLPELVHGDALTTDTHLRIGSDPVLDRHEEVVDESDAVTDPAPSRPGAASDQPGTAGDTPSAEGDED